MTLSADRVGEIRRTADDLPPTPPATKTPWQRQLFVIPLWAGILYYIYYQIVPYLGRPEAEAPLPPHDNFPPYFTLLIVHMAAGAIALLSMCLQAWPWMRQNHPVVHRWVGRAYVFGGAIPGATAGLTIVWFAPPNGRIGIIMVTLFWVITAVTAWVYARKGRYDMHRRFMIYSVTAVLNPVIGMYIFLLWSESGITFDFLYFMEIARWGAWVVPLMIAQWWLYHTEKRPVI